MNRLHPEWQRWIAANLIRGREPDELVEVLVGEGLDRERSAAEVALQAASPGVLAAKETLRPVLLAHRLRRAHLRLGERLVARRRIDGATFRDAHVAAQVPVILPELTASWPARSWTWEGLVERYGEVEIEVCEGREGAALPDRRFREHRARRSFRDVVRRILDPATGNDLYVVANNAVLDDTLGGMLDDVALVDGFLARRTPSSLWMGPAGARTPLHHDSSNVLFCQILGRKRVLLAPPEEVELADHGAGYWSDLDLEDEPALAEAGLAGLAVREAVVEPGESLLIPSGWWHQVLSLEPSLTLTFTSLPLDNAHPWYRPCPPDPLEVSEPSDG